MSEERKLRFKVRRGDLEVELEGDHEYVRTQYERLSESFDFYDKTSKGARIADASFTAGLLGQDPLEGIVQLSSEGRPHLTVPANSLSAKEALSIVLFATHPKPLGDDELSNLLGASWKTTPAAVVRARASELKREGKLIAEKGSYMLSGAGVQWVKGDLIPNLRKLVVQ